LISNIIEALEEITKKHYVSFNTNLTSPKIKEFCRKIDPDKVIEIHASLHIKELERLNLMDIFIRNFRLCKEKGLKIIAVEVAYPKFMNEADKYREFFKKKGINLIFAGFHGMYQGREYPAAYTKHELEVFGIKNNRDAKLSHRGEVCNAGYNAAMVLESGDVTLCVSQAEKLGHIYRGIQFRDHLERCQVDYCPCPLHIFDPYLYKKALKETAKKS